MGGDLVKQEDDKFGFFPSAPHLGGDIFYPPVAGSRSLGFLPIFARVKPKKLPGKNKHLRQGEGRGLDLSGNEGEDGVETPKGLGGNEKSFWAGII